MAEEHQTVGGGVDLDESALGDDHTLGNAAASIGLVEMEGGGTLHLLEPPKSRANIVGGGRGIGVSKGSMNSSTGLD